MSCLLVYLVSGIGVTARKAFYSFNFTVNDSVPIIYRCQKLGAYSVL